MTKKNFIPITLAVVLGLAVILTITDYPVTLVNVLYMVGCYVCIIGICYLIPHVNKILDSIGFGGK